MRELVWQERCLSLPDPPTAKRRCLYACELDHRCNPDSCSDWFGLLVDEVFSSKEDNYGLGVGSRYDRSGRRPVVAAVCRLDRPPVTNAASDLYDAPGRGDAIEQAGLYVKAGMQDAPPVFP